MKIKLTPIPQFKVKPTRVCKTMSQEEMLAIARARTVLNFIHRFTKRHDKALPDVERCFTDGCCWWFAHILCERFRGEMVYDEVDGHFGCEINGRVYDITGDVTDTFRKTYWSVFVEREPNLSVRVLRRCRDFEEV